MEWVFGHQAKHRQAPNNLKIICFFQHRTNCNRQTTIANNSLVVIINNFIKQKDIRMHAKKTQQNDAIFTRIRDFLKFFLIRLTCLIYLTSF